MVSRKNSERYKLNKLDVTLELGLILSNELFKEFVDFEKVAHPQSRSEYAKLKDELRMDIEDYIKQRQ